MKNLHAVLLLMLLPFTTHASDQAESAVTDGLAIAETNVMLYYSSLQAPRRFYGNLLGLEATFEDDWVSIYRTSPGAYVGLVKEGGTAYHSSQPKNAVMLSLAVVDVDAWYEKIKNVPGLVMLKDIYNHDSAPIRAFLVEDPGGYTVEVFQWLK